MRRLTTTILLAAAASLAAAQEGPAVDEEPEVRRYTVEVIVFRYAEAVSPGTEIFVPDEPVFDEPSDSDDDDFVFGGTEPAAGAPDQGGEAGLDDERPLQELTLLVDNEMSMGDIARRMTLLDVYEPILHAGWSQATHPQELSLPIELEVLADPPAGLSGSFMLYLSRYLHLVVDLSLDATNGPAQPVAIEQPGYTFGDERTGFGYDDAARRPLQYTIRENRIFKNGDLRYFDHPKFGVLAKITRVEEDEVVIEEMLGDDPRDLPGVVSQ